MRPRIVPHRTCRRSAGGGVIWATGLGKTQRNPAPGDPLAVRLQPHELALLDAWMAHWSDLVDFEVHPVMTSQAAAEKIAPLL